MKTLKQMQDETSLELFGVRSYDEFLIQVEENPEWGELATFNFIQKLSYKVWNESALNVELLSIPRDNYKRPKLIEGE